MTKENAEKLVEKLNEGLLDKVRDIIREHLGVDTMFDIRVKTPIHTKNVYVNLEENGDATTRQLTATPLLAQIFSKAMLWIDCWGGENSCIFLVHVAYDHGFSSGSNGIEVMSFDYNCTDGSVKVKKTRG